MDREPLIKSASGDELARLKALHALEVLDTPPERMFDTIVQLASSNTCAPIALMSMVDASRQWFKACVGLWLADTPREHSFCAQAIATPHRPLVVCDATKDDRFRDNPLVTGEPGIRSYLGVPLVLPDGHALGTLSVSDTRPRHWTGGEIMFVRQLAGLATDLLLQRRSVKQSQALASEVSQLSQRITREQMLFENMSRIARIGGWELDLATNEIAWTRQTRSICEVPDSYVPRLDTVLDFYAPEARDQVAAAIRDSIRTGQGWTLEVPLITARGRTIHVRAFCTVYHMGDRPARLFGTIQDISEEHARQVELSNALTRADRALSDVSAYQVALDKHAMVAMTDADGVITFVNDRYCQISGYSREELIGADHRLVNSGTHPRAFFQAMWRQIARGEPWQGEICNRTKSGDLHWIDATIVPMLGVDGRPDRYVSVRYDITARKATDAALTDALQKANEATMAKSAFVANMSHEIRTPLNGVIALAGALSQTRLDGRQQEMVSLLRSSGETLERLLSDILDLSRIEAGKLAIENRPFDLRQAIAGATEVMRLKADDKGLSFDVAFKGPADGLFDGDAVRIRQIVSNLASNAIKFTSEGRVSVRVSVTDVDPVLSDVEITVSDSGIGFDAPTREMLFRRFEQADTSITRRFGGSGLGLAICKSLCDMMGGSIEAQSAPGEGSTFTVRLPLTRAIVRSEPVPRPVRPATPAPQASDRSELLPVRVLLAEDHPMNQRIVQIILEPLGFSVTIAANGQEAVEAFQRESFDLILMDMQMPEMDGLTATRAIREIETSTGRPHIPIAMLSANAMAEHEAAAREAGCDLHIAKPVTPDSLCDGVAALLDGLHQHPGEPVGHVAPRPVASV